MTDTQNNVDINGVPFRVFTFASTQEAEAIARERVEVALRPNLRCDTGHLLAAYDRVTNNLDATSKALVAAARARDYLASTIEQRDARIAELEAGHDALRAPAVLRRMTHDEFQRWLEREMPADTIIGDAKWWASRIWSAMFRKQEPVTPPASDEEAAAITTLRECVNRRVLVTASECTHLLTAYDRVTRERDEAREDIAAMTFKLATERDYYQKLLSTIEQRDARIQELEMLVTDIQRQSDRFEEIAAYRYDAIQRLESQLAARADAKPLGWVNVYSKPLLESIMHPSADQARLYATPEADRIAVPVHEHPPAQRASVNDREIEEALLQAKDDRGDYVIRPEDFGRVIAALAPLLNKDAPAPRPASDVLAGIIASQEREAARDRSDGYMVGLYNGLRLAVSAIDNTPYQAMETIPPVPVNPFAAFVDALKADREMQWSYHCNVAMAMYDKGFDARRANEGAALFLERLLGEYTPLHPIPEADHRFQVRAQVDGSCSDAERRVWTALGGWSIDIARTGVLSPSTEVVEAIKALANAADVKALELRVEELTDQLSVNTKWTEKSVDDAERWRWLRDRGHISTASDRLVIEMSAFDDPAEMFDAIIDAAVRAARKQA